jgi:hypothetical protein
MTAVTASPQPAVREADQRLLHSPAVAAALVSGVLAIVVAVVGHMLAGSWRSQNHEKALEVRTALATDMSKSFTLAVGAAQEIASGLVVGPTPGPSEHAAAVQAAFGAGYAQWQINGGRVAAELSARFADEEIVHEWNLYRLAVTRFYRLSAVLPANERDYLIRYVRSYLRHMTTRPWAVGTVPRHVRWGALEQSRKFSRSLAYRRTYDKLSAAFLSLGDVFVQEVLRLRPEV